MTEFDFSLTGKVAIVTGASRGIGKAIAIAFADAGADVACTARSTADLESTAAEIKKSGRRALVLPADLSKKADIDNMVETTLKEFGTIDILVNNAGRDLPVPTMRLREDGWDKVLNTNLKGHYLCMQAVYQTMLEKRSGCIINIASINASMADPYDGAYCVSKAGDVMLTRVVAGELGKYGIRVNAICPGFIRTKMIEAVTENPEYVGRFVRDIPIGRVGEPDDIASVAVFLASDAARYMTGAAVYVDGGLTLMGSSPEVMGATMPEHLQL